MIRPRTTETDGGYSLVELLVAMMVTGVVLAICGTFFANVARLTAAANTSRIATGQAALAIDAISAVVRVAADNPTSSTNTDPAVVSGSPTSLTVTAWTNTDPTNPVPSQVTFTLGADGYLTATTIAGVASNGYFGFTGAVTTHRVAGPFVTSGAAPFFSYIDNTGALLLLSGGTLSVDQRNAVTFISVTPTVAHTDAAGQNDPVVVSSAIGMPNLARSVDGATALQQVMIPSSVSSPSAAPAPAQTTTPPTATPSPTPTDTPTATATPTPTATQTPTSSPTSTSTPSATATPSPTATATPSATATPTPTPTATPTSTPTPTPTPTPTTGTGGTL
ncbi:MAG: PulJ/GspJ family protein [Amnibacterium sp.]